MKYDIVVVGAGMVGAAAAALLGRAGFSVAVVDHEEPSPFDPGEAVGLRVSAISPGAAQVLSEADVLVLLDVYAAGEEPIAGADGRAIARAVRSRGAVEPVFVESLQDLHPVLADILEDGDLVLTMGAGDIGAYAATLPQLLGAKPNLKVHS